MDTGPNITKEREERYNRLLRLVTNYHRTKEQLKDMEEMKRETLFEIALRFKRSQANKTYVFPRANIGGTDPLSEEERLLSGRRDIIYNLNRQVPVIEEDDGKPKRSTIERMETQLVVTDKEKSLKSTLRPLLHRIDVRIEKLLAKETAPKSNRQFTQHNSPTERSDRHMYANGTPRKMPFLEINSHKSQKPQITSERSDSLNRSNLRKDRSTPLVPIHRKIVIADHSSSPADKRAGDRLLTEEVPGLARRRSSKKLHTQQSNAPGATTSNSPPPPRAKLRIETKLTLQTNKIDILNNGLVTLNHTLKPKNLFQKQVF